MNDILKFHDEVFSSRLLIGTGKFANVETMIAAIKASETELVTVALRRFNKAQAEDDLYGPLSEIENIKIMPNTQVQMPKKQ